MKKWMSMFMIVLLCLAAAGCGKKTDEKDREVEIKSSESVSPEADESKSEPERETVADAPETDAPTESVQDKGNALIKEQMMGMRLVFDSLIRENEQGEYLPKDAGYFWERLYLMAANYGMYGETRLSALIEEADGDLRYRSMCMQEFASACFADYNDLLELPADSVVSYDEGWDAYLIPVSDAAMTHVEVVSADGVDGNYTVVVSYMDDESGEVIGTYQFTLISNPYADGIENPDFLYTVSKMEKLS